MKLSVTVVCTNEKKFLEATLPFLAELLRRISSKIIVVDNNSSDGSREQSVHEVFSSYERIISQ